MNNPIKAKIEITDWSELALLEDLLDQFMMKYGRGHYRYDTAKRLYERVRPALMEATKVLDV